MTNHPLYLKASEIVDVVEAFCQSLHEENRDTHRHLLMESAYIIPAKIAGAIGSESWLVSMQNASLIRYHAQYLLTSTSGMAALNESNEQYIKVFRNEMLEFRELFIEWIAEINQLEHEDYDDDWGLFLRK